MELTWSAYILSTMRYSSYTFNLYSLWQVIIFFDTIFLNKSCYNSFSYQ